MPTMPSLSRYIACILGFTFVFVLLGQAMAADTIVKRFLSGTGINSVGIVDASEDTEVEGPQALSTGDNGELYLLDQVNDRIVGFNPKSPSAGNRILEMPGQLAPTDLIVRKSDILVWDGTIHTLQIAAKSEGTSVRGLEEVYTRAADDPSVVSQFAQMGSQSPADPTELLNPNTRAVSLRKQQTRPRQYIATHGVGPVAVEIASRGKDGAHIEVHRNDRPDGALLARFDVQVRDRLGAVEFLDIDHQGRMFVFAEDIPTSGDAGAAFVARYSPLGVLEGIYELPLGNVPLSRRFVTVSSDGDVYFLRIQSAGAEVLAMGFRPLSGRKVIDIRIKETPEPMPALTEGPITALRPLTRQRVIETAFAFEGIQWQVNRGSYGRDPDTVCTGFAGRIRRPFYLHGKLGEQVRGIPYCWGCQGSLAQIQSKIEHGVLAGNICTHNEPRSDATGVDCSSFVSAAWGLSTHFTTAAIPAIAHPVTNPWDLRPGDVFDKPGSHVMLFLRFTPNRMVEVMEASPGGCNGRVCRNVYPLASLLARGYRPLRYRGLESDNTTVAEMPTVEQSRPAAEHQKTRPAAEHQKTRPASEHQKIREQPHIARTEAGRRNGQRRSQHNLRLEEHQRTHKHR